MSLKFKKKMIFIKLLFGVTNCHVIDPRACSMPSSLPKATHKRNGRGSPPIEILLFPPILTRIIIYDT